jgi:hypothetical protein
MKRDDFAKALGWNELNVAPRLGALGLLDTCSRCAGSGRSYCHQYGTKCFKCAGSGKQLPNLTRRLVQLAAERIAAGGLDEYMATLARKAQARKVLPGIVAEAKAVYDVIGRAYSEACKVQTPAETVASALYKFQARNNNLYYGNAMNGDREHPRYLGVSDAESMAKRGELDVESARAIIEARLCSLRELAAEYRRGV